MYFQELKEIVNFNKLLDINPLVSYKSTMSVAILSCKSWDSSFVTITVKLLLFIHNLT